MTDLCAGLEAEARSLIVADQEAGHSRFETLSALLYATAVQAQACGVGPDVVASDLANLIRSLQSERH